VGGLSQGKYPVTEVPESSEVLTTYCMDAALKISITSSTGLKDVQYGSPPSSGIDSYPITVAVPVSSSTNASFLMILPSRAISA
jgi:hypothetical protein